MATTNVRPITIGVQLTPQYGEMSRLRAAWMQAEEMGADRIYSADHFNAQIISADVLQEAAHSRPQAGNNFEGTTVQAAMAATTTRVEIACLVHANSFRNPNLLADIARTIDHISGGRFVLGIGAGYMQQDYDEYGYEYGTAKSRMLDLARNVPIIKSRWSKLNPPPLRKIPLLIAAMGENIGLRLVAEHADIWHVYGELDKLQHKIEVLKRMCREIGRDPAEIEMATHWYPDMLKTGNPDAYAALGFTHIIVTRFGPDWDLGLLRELLQWRQNFQRQR